MPVIICETCQKSFSRKDSLKRHIDTIHNRPAPIINNNNNQGLQQIRNEVIDRTPMPCTICDATILNRNMLEHKRRLHVPWTGPICEDVGTVVDPDPKKAHKPKKCQECGLYFIHLHEHGLSLSEIKASMKLVKEQQQQQVNDDDEQDLPINQANDNQQDDNQVEANIVPPTSEPPAKRQRIDVEQVLKDLDLENIDWDAYDFDEPNNVS